ncbi:MAG: glycosyltransferase family 4 protein [Ignavibacteriae bacterium]|nr:glycosyltransferase family 4 protein [Ignavibacteriota bacterium]
MNIYYYSETQLFLKGAVNKIVDDLLGKMKGKNNNIFLISEENENRPYYYKNAITFKARHGRLRKITHFFNLISILLNLKEKPDIIHVHQIGFSIVPIYYYSLLKNIPMVITNHAYSDYNQTDLRDFNCDYYYRIKRYLMIKRKDINKIYKNIFLVCLSKEMINKLSEIGFDSSKLYHIPNGVEIGTMDNKAENENEEKLSIIWVGRYDVFKNFKLALESFKIIFKENMNVMFNVFGIELSELTVEEKEICVLLKNNMTLHGKVDNLSIHYKNSICLLMTSLSECMSLAMLEALSFGVPVVSTPVSGAREVIEDNKCGIVVNSFSANILANAVLGLLKDEYLYNEMRLNCRKTIENKYNTESMINLHNQMYNLIIKKRLK